MFPASSQWCKVFHIQKKQLKFWLAPTRMRAKVYELKVEVFQTLMKYIKPPESSCLAKLVLGGFFGGSGMWRILEL